MDEIFIPASTSSFLFGVFIRISPNPAIERGISFESWHEHNFRFTLLRAGSFYHGSLHDMYYDDWSLNLLPFFTSSRGQWDASGY